MPKRKKTRKEKIQSDKRNELTQSFFHQSVSTPLTVSPIAAVYPQEKDVHYPFLRKDLLKTSILTFSIIISQLIFFFLLKRDIIVLPIPY